MSIADAGIFNGYVNQSAYTGSATGIFASPVAVEGLARRDGRFTVFYIHGFTGTSNASGQITITAGFFNPSVSINFPIWVINGDPANPVAGNITFNSDGTATVSVGFNGSFSSSATVGIVTSAFSYPIFKQAPF